MSNDGRRLIMRWARWFEDPTHRWTVGGVLLALGTGLAVLGLGLRGAASHRTGEAAVGIASIALWASAGVVFVFGLTTLIVPPILLMGPKVRRVKGPVDIGFAALPSRGEPAGADYVGDGLATAVDNCSELRAKLTEGTTLCWRLDPLKGPMNLERPTEGDVARWEREVHQLLESHPQALAAFLSDPPARTMLQRALSPESPVQHGMNYRVSTLIRIVHACEAGWPDD